MALLLLAAGAALAFIFGLFQELVDSNSGSNLFEEISNVAPANPLHKFTSPAFLAIALFLGVLIVSFIFARSRLSHWTGALLLAVLLLLIGTPLADNLKLLKASPPGLNLENGLTLSRGGGISDDFLGIKGPIHPSEEPVFKVRGAKGVSYLRVTAGDGTSKASPRPAPSSSPTSERYRESSWSRPLRTAS